MERWDGRESELEAPSEPNALRIKPLPARVITTHSGSLGRRSGIKSMESGQARLSARHRPSCFSRDTRWVRSFGRGPLYSFAILHRPPNEAWRDAVPYVVAIVELGEGARMPTNLVGVEPDPERIRVGMRVTVTLKQVSEEI